MRLPVNKAENGQTAGGKTQDTTHYRLAGVLVLHSCRNSALGRELVHGQLTDRGLWKCQKGRHWPSIVTPQL